jgi:hypothetical protein
MGRYPKEQWNIPIHSVEEWSLADSGQKGLEIIWSSIHGFGTFQYYLKDGKFHIADDEYMGNDFAQEVLNLAMRLKEVGGIA